MPGVGCLNFDDVSLGEIYAIDVKGPSHPYAIGAFVQTMPATPAQLAAATPDCAAFLSVPTETGVEPANTYTITQMEFSLDASVSYMGVSANAQASVGKSFSLSTGEQLKTTLADPERLVACGIETQAALTDYWNALTAEQQSTTAFFIVTQVVAATLSTAASNGASVGGALSTGSAGAGVGLGLSNGCNELEGLAEPDAGGAPTFYDGRAFLFSPGAGLRFAGSAGTCGTLLTP